MSILPLSAISLLVLSSDAFAENLRHFQTLYDEQSVETRDLLIQLRPVGDEVDFSITLRNKATGFEREHVFQGQGANDPAPFQVEYLHYCDTNVLLLTIEFPWRHDLPHYVRVLDTYAFRKSDFEYVDDAFGLLTDITMQDERAWVPADIHMLPPIGVHCLSEPGGKLFEFFLRSWG
jgi:hypothetical protein